MGEIRFLVKECIEGGYTACAVGESIFVEGDTLESLRANALDAIKCHFEPAERPEFLELQWADHGLTDEQMKELARRIEDFRNNPDGGIPWEDVKADLRRRHNL